MKRILLTALDDAGRRGADSVTADHIVLAVVKDPQSGGAIVLNACRVSSDRMAEHLNRELGGNGAVHIAQSLDESALKLLRAATNAADRLEHGHVGTEHVAIALADATSRAGEHARQMGLTERSAEAAAVRWIRSGMPRPGSMQRRGLSRLTLGQKILRAPELGWKIFIRRSLGHPGFRTNPYPLYQWLQKHAPLRLDPLVPVWVATRYDDVAALLREPVYRKDPIDDQRLPDRVAEQLDCWRGVRRFGSEVISLLFLDPPVHTRVRAAFTRQFTPATLANLRPRVELIASKRFDLLAGKDRFDLIEQVAYPLPVIVIAELLGFPGEDYALFKKWSDILTASLAINAKPQHLAAAGEMRGQMRAYFDKLVPKLKANPDGPLLSRLLNQEESAGGLSREEIFSNAVLLLAAGHETTTNLIGNGVLALMRYRDQWERLLRDPSLVDSAVEEMLRFDTPVQWVSRLAAEETQLGGIRVPADQIILGSVGAANRDPERFADPDRFDIGRSDNRHLSFGTGIHFCLGAALARMETQIVLKLLIERFPKLRLAPEKLEWMAGLTFRGVTRLPLLFG